jgi:stage V sporulation protein B
MLTSILNGLGKTGATLLHNATGSLIRILFVLFTIPLIGIRGYLYGLLLSEMLLSIMHIYTLYHTKS